MIHLDPTNLASEPAVASATGPERARALMEQQLDYMARLTEMALDVADAARRRVVAKVEAEAEAPQAERDPVMAFNRAARAVRLTVALRAKLIRDLIALGEAAPAAKARVVEVPNPEAERLNGRRERIARIVRRVIEDDQGDEDEIERLSSACWERLTDDDIYGDILARPIGEMVGRVCEDLEIPVNWVRLAREAWAVEEAASGVVGSPFVKPAPTAGSP